MPASDAQRRATARYQGKTVVVRLNAADAAKIDSIRGDLTPQEKVREIIRRARK